MGRLEVIDEDIELKHYEVRLSESALEALREISSKADYLKVRRRMQMLRIAPSMGAIYRPIYESAMPDHEVRATYAGHFGIYFTIDEEASEVTVEYVEDSRRDPLKKFS